jgi:uncharacterized protein YjbI with pentapeptide repeats
MANPDHLRLLCEGVDVWNAWRAKEPLAKPDLSKADLSQVRFVERMVPSAQDRQDEFMYGRPDDESQGIELSPRTVLKAANLSGMDLRGARLAGADLVGVDLSGAALSGADLGDAYLSTANLSGAILTGHTNLCRADLSGANLSSRCDLSGAVLLGANLSRANLSTANFTHSNLSSASLRKAQAPDAIFRYAVFYHANLSGGSFERADLSNAYVKWANLSGADLSGAHLAETDLQYANLVEANLAGADLTGCKIYGVSTWGLKFSETTKQHNLIITAEHEAAVVVDRIEVAQFVYLLLQNEKIRDVIDTIGKKGVLLLGRFTGGRLAVLERLREELRKRGFVPMVFTFDRPETKDFSETIRLLAGLSHFVIVDVTNPRSAPLELQATVPECMVPFVPIMDQTEEPFAMLRDLWVKHRDWVLKPIRYSSVDRLIEVLDTKIIGPAQARFAALLARKAEEMQVEDV